MARESADQPSVEEHVEARRRRLGALAGWSTSGSVQQFAALAASGFDPVGHVMGTTVLHLGNLDSRARCSGTSMYTSRTDLASQRGPFQGLLRQLNGARRIALARAVAECGAQHGDGILGARIAVTEHGGGVVEFTVQGTAVRARSRHHLATPFSAHVPSSEFSALLHSGWMPVSVVYAVAIGSRHDDDPTLYQTRRRMGASGNGEVSGYSRLVNDTRRDARALLKTAVDGHGCDGVVVNELTLRIDERECPKVEGRRDHIAEAAIAGTALVAFAVGGGGTQTAPPTIMRLDSGAGGRAAEPVHVRVETAEGLTDHQGLADRIAVSRRSRRARKDPFSRNQGE